MKKKSLILIMAIATLFVSCNDAIDIKQDGQVTNPQEIFRNSTDIERGVIGIYSVLPGETEIAFTSTFTDELGIGIDNGGQGLRDGEYGFFMQPGNSYALSIWTSYYGAINRINRMINSTDELIAKLQGVNNADANAERKRLQKSKGDLIVLRAYSHYKLFAYFTPDYTNPSGFAIMKLDFLQTDDYTVELGRSTVKEIKDFIISDLDDASTLYSQAAVPFSSSYYVTQGMIDAIKTKLYSMVGEYDKVITFGDAVISNPSTQLANATQYKDYFDDKEISKEIIFQLKRVRGGASVASAWYSIDVSEDGSPFYEVGRSLYNEIDKLDPTQTGSAYSTSRGDVRYGVNILSGSKVATDYATITQTDYQNDDVLLIGKYKGRPSQSLPLQNNIPIFRAADIYLAMAEARAAQGALVYSGNDIEDLLDPAVATQTVEGILVYLKFNRITNTAILARPNITSSQSAWNAILDARRVEFAFEGHRYLDMKRLGIKAGSTGFDRYSKDCSVNGACNLPATDHKLTLPIPTRELNGNTVIRPQQNPGY